MAIPDGREIRFGPFWLDVEDERLWKGAEATRLRPKSFAVLRYLLERPGRLVTKEELFAKVWPGLAVGDDVLTGCLGELRLALGDDPRRPSYLETVHRRGYRFIGAVPGQPGPAPQAPGLVGRGAELERLHAALANAVRGQRQIVFVTGEAGIGKTTLVDVFLERAATSLDLRIGRGESLEHFGAGEPYLPFLAALDRLCRGADGASLVPLLRRRAPTWLVQLPALLDENEIEAVRRRAAGGTQARMMRELAEALEAATAERPLVLVLDDLHWSDPATVDLLAYLGRRRDPARLLLIGTYRPVELIVRGHPLLTVARDLSIHRQCQELTLELLTQADIARYLAACPGEATRTPDDLERLATTLHRRTDGHPLFMVTVVEALTGRDVDAAIAMVDREVPESLRQMIEQQLERLSVEDQALLEAASAAGAEWSAAVVAAALDGALEDVDARCARLARRRHFLTPRGVDEWPDGTVTARYAFVHALHQQVCYERLPLERAARVHRRIGAQAEAGYGEAAGDHAAELAEHFERGRDAPRALRHRRQAALNALRRWAYPEAVEHLTHGRDVLRRLPETAERMQQELDLLTALGPALSAVRGQGAPDVGETYTRARELCRLLGETPQLFAVLHGLRRFHTARAEHETAQEIGGDLLRLAERQDDPALLLEAHFAIGVSRFHLYDAEPACEHFERGAALAEGVDASHLARYGLDTSLLCLAYAALTHWMLGFPDRTRRWSERALARAHGHPHAVSRVMTLVLTASLTQLLRETAPTQEQAEAAIALCREHGIELWAALGTVLRGWAIAHRGEPGEGLALMREGRTAFRATGGQVAGAYQMTLLIEGHLLAGLAADGLALLAQEAAAAARYPRDAYRGELQRLRGELLLLSDRDRGPRARPARRAGRAAEAETCFRTALDVTHERGVKLLELRAAVSLGRLWQSQGKARAARELVEPLHAWFTEGLDTTDVQAARVLLDELGAS